MEKLDRRVRRTQQLLGEALVSLIPEKGYDAITVRDITDRADVAHATFYRHYRNKDELLAKRLEVVITELEGYVREPTLRDAEGYLIFKHVQENSTLYRILLDSQGTTRVRKHVKDIIAANFLRTCDPLLQTHSNLIPPPIAANHMAASLLALIEWWLEHNIPYPPHQMAKIYDYLIKAVTLDAVQDTQSLVSLD